MVKKVPKGRVNKTNKIKMTRIEDLDELEDNSDIEKEVKIKKPPVPVRNGAGTYSFDDEDYEIEEPVVSNKKKSGESDKGNIMDMAMAMRQEREKENKERDNNK